MSEEVLKNIKQEPSVEFLVCLPTFDEAKTLGGKMIIIKQEKQEDIEDGNQKIQKFPCASCVKSFKTKERLTRHEKTHDKVRCKFCMRQVPKDCLEQHVKAHECGEGRTLECNFCPKIFFNSSGLRSHEASHDERLFSCDLCGNFYKKNFLRFHFKIHVRTGKYKCLTCFKFFETQNLLKLHSMDRQSNPMICQRSKNPGLKCKICGKEFKSLFVRQNHEKVHRNKVDCPICHKNLKQNTIQKHLRYHELMKNEKKFKCTGCPKIFWSNEILRSHEKYHNKFECDLCGKKIAEKHIFRGHLETHFSSQTFDCKICVKTFATLQKLQHNKNCHRLTSEKLECDICHKIVYGPQNIRYHKRTHTKKACPVCSKALKVHSLANHMKKLHPEQSLNWRKVNNLEMHKLLKKCSL